MHNIAHIIPEDCVSIILEFHSEMITAEEIRKKTKQICKDIQRETYFTNFFFNTDFCHLCGNYTSTAYFGISLKCICKC